MKMQVSKKIISALCLLSPLALVSAPVSAAGQLELSEVSTRAFAGSGEDQMVLGAKAVGKAQDTGQVMVIAIGPTMGASNPNLTDVLQDPKFTVTDTTTGQVIGSCDNWKSCPGADEVAKYLEATGQTLQDNEAAMVLNVRAGSYTANIEGANEEDTGLALGAFINFVGESPEMNITTGEWNGDGVCFNVSEDRLKLTAENSTCRDGAAFSINTEGKNEDGGACNLDFTVEGNILINENGTFGFIDESNPDLAGVTGVFNTDVNASGFSAGDKRDPCAVDFSAQPGPSVEPL